MKILVVEDTDDSRVLLVDLLEVQGYEVESAINGVEALEKIRIAPPDIIISDILMPEMDGFELCQTLKKDPQLKKIPFIFYTATYTEPSDQKLALSMGATRFIIKPEDPIILRNIVAEVVDEYEKGDLENLNEQRVENNVFKKQHKEVVSNKLYKKIIELEEQKEKLKKSEKKYRMMMESIIDAVYICSPARKITYLNPAMIKRLGRDATGEVCYKAIHGLNEQCKWCVFEMLKSEKSIVSETLSPLDNRAYRINNMPIYNDDNSVSKMSIYKDITDYLEAVSEKEKAQSLLVQSQKMEAIGTLAGGIAHDFNNILSKIIGYTELALGGIEKGTELEDDLQEVYMAGLRAKDLVKQILTFAHKSDEEVKPIQVNIIVKEVLKFIKSSIPAIIQINDNLNSDSLIMGSPTQIHQVLMNLCTNAAHAMGKNGGILEVSLNDTTIYRMTMSELKPGEYIEIKVSDTGMGISPENIHTIFDPYFTTKAVGEGTGLGLAVVHGIVKKYGGKITVNSTIGKGTCFTIYLPIAKKRKVHTHSEKEDVPLGNENVLFVDDEAPIAKIGSRVLEKLGYLVTTRTSSVEALELFRSKPQAFDLVVTDMTMPNMTGDKLAAELMKIRPDIPVVLCTGYNKKISNESAKAFGIKAFVYKPIVIADLAKTVRKVLDEAKS